MQAGECEKEDLVNMFGGGLKVYIFRPFRQLIAVEMGLRPFNPVNEMEIMAELLGSSGLDRQELANKSF